MALQNAKALLDELMGRNRDLGPEEKNCNSDWRDARVDVNVD